MKDLELDFDGKDLVTKNGDIKIIQKDDAIRQNISQRLQMFIGEWFLDTSKGVPYYQYILMKNPDMDLVSASLKDAILKTPGVLELIDFDFDFLNSNRTLSVTLTARTTAGEVTITTGAGVGA